MIHYLDLTGVSQLLTELGRPCSPRTLYNYRQTGRMVEPDAMVGDRPAWLRETILAWVDSRPGRGVGGGRPRKIIMHGVED